MLANSRSSTRSAHDLWVQIMTDDDRPYFWNRLDRTSHWVMPPGSRPGWVRTLDGLIVHLENKNAMRSISGMS